jgi:T5SS/PEP-CTERM-associated repeat protein
MRSALRSIAPHVSHRRRLNVELLVHVVATVSAVSPILAGAGEWLYWERHTGEAYLSDANEWKTQAGTVSSRAPGTGDEVIIRGPGTLRIDANHLPSGTIDQMWVGDGSPMSQWPNAPIAAGAGNVIQTSGTVQYTSWFIIGRAGAPGESTYDMQGGQLVQVGNGAPFVLGNNAGYGSATNPTRGTLTMSNDASISQNNSLWVGDDTGSIGTLVMRDSARFDANEIDIGWYRGGTGHVTLSGSAALTSRNYAVLGQEGGIATLTMRGASVYNGNYGHMGGIRGGTSMITLEDNARINFTNWFNFGEVNATARMTLGGNARITSNSIDFGWGAGSDSQATLHADSSLVITQNLNLGVNGSNQGTLTLNDRATATAGYLNTGCGAADAKGTLTLNGASAVTITNGVNFGGEGGTGRLVVNGGRISTGSAWMGYNGGHGFATVTSGTWAASGPLNIGMSGGGDATLTVNGGHVTSAGTTIIGTDAGATGTVDITAGRWTNSGVVRVGNSGSGSVSVSGGLLDTANMILGTNSGGTGTVIVTGGTATNNSLYAGYAAGATGSIAVTGGELTSRNSFFIGHSGTGSLLLTGGTVKSTATYPGMYVGFAAGSNGSVTVRGGLLDASAASGGGSLYVGNSGTGRLDLEAGQVRSDFATIGSGNGSQGTALITGGTWTNTQTAFIGSGTGSRGSLTVDGGTVESVWTFVADSAGSIGQVALRSGSFDAGSYLYVGNNGSGSMSISGGAGEAGWAWLGVWAGSSGSMNLTGGTFQTWGGMEVGYQGTGSLTIDGGRLANWGDTTVGSAAGGFGTVTVTSGTLGNWGSMTIGAVGSGSLSVSGSGVVHISDALHVGPNGTVSIGPGGTLDLGWSYTISGDPPVGTLSDGSVMGNITNDGRLYFNRGSSVDYAGIISGSGEVVKMGSAPLTFTGMHTFTGTYVVTAGRLSIDGSTAAGSRIAVASGATLAGTGLVGGVTTIDGTLSPGNSPGVLTFGDDLTFASGGGVQWELAANDTTTGPLPLFDRIVVSGDLTFAGSNVLSLVFAASGSSVDWGDDFWTGEARWTLFEVADGRSTLGLGGVSIVSTDWLDSDGTPFSALRRGSFSLALEGNDVLLVYTPVPEPATAVLAFVGLGIMFLDRHRRRTRRRAVETPPA